MVRSFISVLTASALFFASIPARADHAALDAVAASVAADIDASATGLDRALARLHAEPVARELARYGVSPGDAELAIARLAPEEQANIATLGNQLDVESQSIGAGDRNLIITVVLIIAIAAVLVALVD